MKIYLAGPLFSSAEREFNARLTEKLREKKHEVWLPQENEQEAMSPKQIFEEDVRGVNWADVVVANMDGPDPDSGTCWECGYAFGKKPVVVFRTDFRVGYEIRGDLQVPLALRHKTILRRAVQWLALGADRLGFAGVRLAFLHEAVFGGAVQWLALGAHGLAFTGLCHGRADGKKCNRSCESQCSQEPKLDEQCVSSLPPLSCAHGPGHLTMR